MIMIVTYCVSTKSSQKTCIQSRSSLTGQLEVRNVEWFGTIVLKEPRSCHVDNLSMKDSRRSSAVVTATLGSRLRCLGFLDGDPEVTSVSEEHGPGKDILSRCNRIWI